MLTPEGKVMTIEEMKDEGKRPVYKPVEVQTAQGQMEVWQMLPEPEDIEQEIIQFPEQEGLKKAA